MHRSLFSMQSHWTAACIPVPCLIPIVAVRAGTAHFVKCHDRSEMRKMHRATHWITHRVIAIMARGKIFCIGRRKNLRVINNIVSVCKSICVEYFKNWIKTWCNCIWVENIYKHILPQLLILQKYYSLMLFYSKYYSIMPFMQQYFFFNN